MTMKLLGKRQLLFLMTLAVALLVACGPGGICETDDERRNREAQEFMRVQQMMQAAAKAASATATATSTPTTAAASATAATSATAAAAAFGGKIAFGFDHPPFAPGNGAVGGNSVGVVCGAITGAPSGSIITINLTGGTGAPASVKGPIGGDGGFMIPFPIMSYGVMNGAVAGIAGPSGSPLSGTVPPAALEVKAGADVTCNAR